MLTKEMLQKAKDLLNATPEIIDLGDNVSVTVRDAFGFQGDPLGEIPEPKVFRRTFVCHSCKDNGKEYVITFSDGVVLFVPYETVIETREL